jgi:CubicO group peptidase (beta-lactamase class C family)
MGAMPNVSDQLAEQQSRPLAGQLDAVFSEALRARRVVGAVALVAQHGRLLYRRAHGYAERETQRPMLETTLFRLASVSKPYVAAAALRLIASDVLRLDDPVARWLPAFRPRLADGSEPTITIHHLLTHTAGLSYGLLEEPGSPFHALAISDGIDRVDFDLAENLRRLSLAPLAYAPGAGWRYSLALDVLGGVLEAATGSSLPDAVNTLVCVPLALRETGFATPDHTRFAVPYANAEPEPVLIGEQMSVPLPEGHGVAVRFSPSRVFDGSAYPSGGAGMYGCADDVLTLLEALRADDAFLPEPLAAAARADHTGSGAETRGPGWGFSYLGAFLADPAAAASPQSAGTLQWGGVYGHSWFIDSARGLSVVLLTNTAYEGMSGALTLAVRDTVYRYTGTAG